ncbi:peptidase M20 [Actinoplanes sp. NBRC 14428]|nr:peptidase M20 [Actinoplanes sp. NBRC 14428]
MTDVNGSRFRKAIDGWWRDEVVRELSGLIAIPAVSPAYEPDWAAKGTLHHAVRHVREWILGSGLLPGAHTEVIEFEGRTPLLLVDVPATSAAAEGGTVVLYGHLDKQPPLGDWSEGLGPWQPVLRDGRLYGRGAVDDGYAGYAAVTALAAVRAAGGEHGRAVVLLETGEESGSPDLPAYLEHLAGRLGDVELVICLDSAGLDNRRLWLTTSLRGAVQATVTVRVLDHPQHSGIASGIVPSSFRILRSLLDRVEDAATGRVTVPEMHTPIPDARRAETELLAALQPGVAGRFPFAGDTRPMDGDDTELLLNNTWRPALSVIGAAGLPDPGVAGAVLRASTSLRLSFRLPPTVDPETARQALVRTLTTGVPYGADVEVTDFMLVDGWNAAPRAPWLTAALDEVSEQVFSAPCAALGVGGGIPFIEMLGRRYPSAQFVVTGAIDPDGNMHGIDESIDLAHARRVTEAIACLIAAHAERAGAPA